MSKQRTAGILVALAALCGCGPDGGPAGLDAAAASSQPPSSGTVGKVYAAGVGGHMAVASVAVDPANPTAPLTISRLDRIRLGPGQDYGFHDVRIDKTRGRAGKVFWSTINADSTGGYHYGRTDIASGRVECDVKIALPAGSNAPGYCGSGQSADKFLPIWMGVRGFVDVIDKDTCVLEKRVYLDQIAGMPPYWNMAHGTNTKDFRTLTIALNLLDAAGVTLNQGMLVNLDMASVLAGAPVMTAAGPAVQGPAKTIFYRQEWTPDGTVLAQGGKAAFYRFDANLTEQCRGLLPLENGKQTETHDLTLVPNSDYAVMHLRRWMNHGLSVPVLDGQLQLVKLSTCETVGPPVSMCNACHNKNGMIRESPGLDSRYVSCGLDSTW